MALIPITGIPSTDRVPGTYAQGVFGQGPSTASAGARFAFYCAPKTASGNFTVNTVYPIKNENEVIVGGGAGSPLHQFVRGHLAANKAGKIFVMAIAATSGGGASAATGSFTFSGTATAKGLATLLLTDVSVPVAINTGDGYAAIASNAADAINAVTYLPFTASASNGVVTLLAKINGISQNGVLRYSASVVASGVTVSNAGSTLSGAVEGTTTENANFTAALSTISAVRYYYMGTHATDATNLTTFLSHIVNKSDPNPGMRSVGVAFTPVALSSGITLAVAKNNERLQIAWQYNAPSTPAFIVGQIIGTRQRLESEDSAWNFDGWRDSARWLVAPTVAKADWPDHDDLNDAITNGLSPIASDQNGSYWVMSVNTRSKDATGAFEDLRSFETHRVSVVDEILDTLIIADVNTYSGFKLKDDEYLADGKANINQTLAPKVLTPSQYKPFLRRIINRFAADKLKNVAANLEALQCFLDPSNGGRLEVGIPLDVINLKHQTTIRASEVSAG